MQKCSKLVASRYNITTCELIQMVSCHVRYYTYLKWGFWGLWRFSYGYEDTIMSLLSIRALPLLQVP